MQRLQFYKYHQRCHVSPLTMRYLNTERRLYITFVILLNTELLTVDLFLWNMTLLKHIYENACDYIIYIVWSIVHIYRTIRA